MNGLFSCILGIPRSSFAPVLRSFVEGGWRRRDPSGLLKARRPSRMPTRERFLLRQAYGGTGRPDNAWLAKLRDSSLRPFSLRNMESTAITTREGRPV